MSDVRGGKDPGLACLSLLAKYFEKPGDEVGQEAEVKVDSFPFTKYGTLPARVGLVSLDVVKDEESQTKDYYFPIRVSVADPTIRLENGKRVPLSPGMTVTAEVKTGTCKPIEYVLAPLKKYGAESGRER